MTDDFARVLRDWENKQRQEASGKKGDWARSLEHYGAPREDLQEKIPGPDMSKIIRSTKAHRRQHPVQDEMDLHGMTILEAQKALEVFLKESRASGFKKIKIIHGRGLHSGKDAVLRPLVQKWADALKLPWETCSPPEGGPGALWIWLVS